MTVCGGHRRLDRFNRLKRGIDVLIVVLSAPLSVPVGLVVAGLIRLRLGRPVLFRQVRPGKDEEPFELLKFRTMTDARSANGDLLPDRQRLTRFGAKLRATSLDEVPQLINILSGHMSFVGPRPLLPSYLDYYAEEELCRHAVRPGITGLAQVSGRNRLLWDDRLAADVRYVASASLRLDFGVIVQTIKQVTRGTDVSVVASDSGRPLHIERHFVSNQELLLRRLTASDLKRRVQWVNDASTRKHMQWPDQVTEESTRVWFNKVREDVLRQDLVAIDLRTRQSVAMAGFVSQQGGSYEFYVFVDPSRHGLGIGGRVTELAVNHAKQALGATELTLTVASSNVAAIRIYHRLGFVTTRTYDCRVWMRKDL